MTRSELKHQAILDAAKEAFQEHGVQGTSMDMLAAKAEVSKRTVYNHFSSKEELVIELTSKLWQQAMQQIDIAYDANTDLRSQLLALVEAEIEVFTKQEYLDLFRVAFGHYFYQPEDLQREMAKYSIQETALARWLQAAQKDGKLKAFDIEFGTNQLHSLLKGSCFWPLLLKLIPAPTAEEKKYLAEETVGMFLCRYEI